jgi:baculoviral IAP repeat-containing protein 1
MENAFKHALLAERISYTNKEDVAKAGFYYYPYFDGIVCVLCGWKSRGCLSLDHINFLHKVNNPDCELVQKIPQEYHCYTIAKKCATETEKMMIRTFDSWPLFLPDVNRLVKAGFYYSGYSEEIACISCGLTIRNWNDQKDPLIEHKKLSPDCNLLATI